MSAAVDLTLPVATGGNDGIVYTLTPAIPGLTLDPSTRVLSGAPTTAAGATTYTYTAADSDANEMASDTATLTVSITVRTAATGFTLSLFDNDIGGGNAPIVSTLFEGFPQAVRATAVPTPAGSVFAADQQITFAVAAPPTRPDSAADPYVGYTAVAPGTIPLAVGAASASYNFMLMTTMPLTMRISP